MGREIFRKIALAGEIFGICYSRKTSRENKYDFGCEVPRSLLKSSSPLFTLEESSTTETTVYSN
jgi:hypothetical protein